MGSASSKRKHTQKPQTHKPSPQLDVKADPVRSSPAPDTNQKGRDVMISYSHKNADVMRKLEAALKAKGISVWVDEDSLAPGAVYLREIGEAIVASKLFIVLLSVESVQSKYCQDEVSLAYISNKSIFAVSILPFDEISKVMDLGLKLTLSCVQWTFLQDGDFSVIDTFVNSVRAALDKIDQQIGLTDDEPDTDMDEVQTNEDSDCNRSTLPIMNKQALDYRVSSRYDSTLLPARMKTEDSETSEKFWKINFGEAKTIDWLKFVDLLTKHMTSTWYDFSVTEETIKHLMTLLAKEMNVVNNKLQYANYMLFCTRGKEIVALDEAISLFAAAAVAVREVFQIDSSVRLTAIEHLGDHKSKAVIQVLLDLLYDEDQDVRVVAAISLAHAASEIKSIKTRSEVVNGLLSCLKNDDRLVRESGCLALGRMKSKAAIRKLVYIWRNDYISSVREAAEIAIEQIGGDDAEQAMHITRVLKEEIEKLKS